MEIKIKEYKIRGKGKDGKYQNIYLPKEWVNDLGIKPGDVLEMYRDENDRLIISQQEHSA